MVTMANDNKISTYFSFGRYGLSVPKAQEALTYYKANNKDSAEWLSTDSRTHIFIDTNVLLKLYKISRENRESMLEFFNKNKERIYICGQVGQEYLKHRCTEIKHYATTISNIQKEIRSLIEKIRGLEVRKSLDGLFKNDLIQDDMPKTYSLLGEIVELYKTVIRPLDTHELYEKINNSVADESQSLIEGFQYEYEDPILEAISALNHLVGLDQKEEAYTKDLYNSLLQEYKTNNSSEDYAFPGCGDKNKLKFGRPAHGDLIIFHEMLKHVKETDTDCVFVTSDVTKGDWIKRDGLPFIHYIYSIFDLTGHMIFICSEKDFPMSFDSISGEKDKDEHSDDDIEEIIVPEQEDSPERNESSMVDNCPQTSIEISPKPSDSVSEDTPLDEIGESSTSQLAKRYTSSGYREINPDAFISELRMAIDWARNYGAGYVNKYLFVSKILRNHHYDIRSAFRVMNQLISDRKIIVRRENHNGRNMDCLDIMTTDIIPTSE